MADVLSKKALIASIAELNDITKTQAETNVDSVINTIKSALEEGMEVNIHEFGTFLIKPTEARKGRNPATGESIDIPKSAKMCFTPAKSMKELAKGTV